MKRRVAARRWVKLGCALVVAGALAAGGLELHRRHQQPLLSQTITRAAPQLGPGAQLLLPNLRGAVVWVPDRPHDPAELAGPDRLKRFARRRRFTVSTNSQGLRGPAIKAKKSGPRVLCVGDSVTFGWGVTQQQSFPARLAQLLGVEVINAGVPANKPPAMAAWIQQHGARLEPDLVLFSVRPNRAAADPWGEFAEAVRAAASAVKPAPLAVVLPPVSTFDPHAATTPRQQYLRARQLVAPLQVLDLTPAFRARLPLPGVIMEQRHGVQRMLRLPGRQLVAQGSAPARGVSQAIIDAFEADPTLAEPLFFDGGHPDARGFEVFAGELAAWIRRMGLLPEVK